MDDVTSMTSSTFNRMICVTINASSLMTSSLRMEGPLHLFFADIRRIVLEFFLSSNAQSERFDVTADV